jgi:ABC-type transport system substrate-binding protein
VAAYDEVHCAVANALAAAWGKDGLGFDVKVNKRGTIANNDVHKDVAGIPTDLCDDLWAEDLANGNYQAAVLDLVAISADPFSVLAPFATTFSGQAVDMSSSEEPKPSTHITGYNSAEYDALIEAIYAEKTIANRSEKLHEAEAQLMDDMPVIPIVFNEAAYLINEDVLDLGNKILFWDKASEYYAPVSFDKATIKNYEDYELACAKYVADNFEKWQANPTSYFALSFGESTFAAFAHTNSNYYYLFKGKYGTEGYEWIPAKPAKDATETETSAD